MIMDYRLAMYLMGVEGALEDGRIPAKYLINTCPECGSTFTTWTDATSDLHIVINIANDWEPKKYAVIVGCEGYWVINPEVVGVDASNWEDWTDLGGDPVCVCGPAGDRPATMDNCPGTPHRGHTDPNADCPNH